MGFLSQRANQKKTAPVTLKVGPWLAKAQAELPALSDTQLMFLVGLSTTVGAHAILSGARSSILGDGKQNSVAKMVSNRDSILRFEGFGSFGQLTLGIPGSVLDWRTDWSMRYSFGATSSEITVPDYRTWDDDIANYARLDKIRALLADTLVQGPDWVISQGYPRAADYLTSIRCDSSSSPIARDYCDPLEATRLAPMRVACPPQTLADAAATLGYVTGSDTSTGELLIYIAPDGNPDQGVIRLRGVDDAHAGLVFPDPQTPAPIEQQRLRRRSLRLVKNLVNQLKETVPAITALEQTIAALAAASADPTKWVEAWTDQTLAPQWMVTPGSVVPVAVVITSTGHGSMLNRMIAGASSVALRRRTYTRGMTRKSRDNARLLMARNAAILTGSDGSYQPYLRYVSTPDVADATLAVADTGLPMFWEVFHNDQVGDPATTTVLFTSGLGTTNDTVIYGNELMNYVDAFCSTTVMRDQQATFQTIGLRVPGAS